MFNFCMKMILWFVMKVFIKSIMMLATICLVAGCQGPPLEEDDVTQFDRYDRLHGASRDIYKDGKFGERKHELKARLKRRE